MLISRFSLYALINALFVSSSALFNSSGEISLLKQPIDTLLERKEKEKSKEKIADNPKGNNRVRSMDPIRFSEINRVLEMIPEDLNSVIQSYEHDTPLSILHSKVMNELKLTGNEYFRYEFDNRDFAIRLYERLNSIQNGDDPISKDGIFWDETTRLLFKWIIHMRSQSNNADFNSLLRDAALVASITNKYSSLKFPAFEKLISHPDPSNPSRMIINGEERRFFEELVGYEVMDNEIDLYDLGQEAIDFIHELKKQGMNQNGLCKELKTRYFMGDWTNNFSLKFIIFKIDREGSLHKCFEDCDDSQFPEAVRATTELLQTQIGYETNTSKLNLKLLNPFMVKNVLKKSDFYADNPNDLIIILRKLREAKMLSIETINFILTILKQQDYQYYMDDSAKAIFFLRRAMNENESIRDECQDYLKLFVQTKSLDNLYDRVLKALDLEPSRKVPTFVNSDFASKIHSILVTKADPNGLITSLEGSSFWFDLTRLLFKWALYMRQFFYDNQEAFEEAMKPLKEILKIIQRNAKEISLPEDFTLITSNGFDEGMKTAIFFRDLINEELIKDDQSFEKFDIALRKFYVLHQESCDELRNEFFSGNFNTDPLLRLLMVTFDPLGKIKRCFTNIDYTKLLMNEPIINVNQENINSLLYEWPENDAPNNMKLLNNVIFEIALSDGSKKMKFNIKGHYNYNFLSKKMDKTGLLDNLNLAEPIKIINN